jgi:hypothetical protein
MFEYPKTYLDRAEDVRALAGGYWIEVYEGKDQVEDLVDARNTLWQASLSTWQEAEKSKSRFAISPFKIKTWSYFPIFKSKGISVEGVFGGGATYGGQGLAYGQTAGASWSLTGGLASVSQIYNRISNPSASLYEGIDFSIDPVANRLVFNTNPFSDSRFATKDVIDASGNSDTELALWLYSAKFDLKSIQQIYGLPIGVDGASSEDYKQLINNVYDCLILGMSAGRLANILGHSLQAPVAKTNEIIERIHDSDRKVVITDKNVYFLTPKSSASVSVGDSVIAGTSLSTGLRIQELRSGSDISGINAITLGKGLISNQFAHDLTFTNNTVPTKVTTRDDLTELSFEVGGHPFDVDHFWEVVHRNGEAQGRTIAQGLDSRVVKVGEPTAESLPTSINPLRFLIDEIIPGGITLVTIRAEEVAKKIPRLDIVPDLVALGNGVFFIFEAPLAMDSSFDVQSASADKYTGANTVEEYISLALLNSAVTIKSISSQCS